MKMAAFKLTDYAAFSLKTDKSFDVNFVRENFYESGVQQILLHS
jgi:hypothetical protein